MIKSHLLCQIELAGQLTTFNSQRRFYHEPGNLANRRIHSRERLLTFLDEAEDTEATLAVYAEIERVKGGVQYVEQAGALSLVGIELLPDVLAGPIEVGGVEAAGGAASGGGGAG